MLSSHLISRILKTFAGKEILSYSIANVTHHHNKDMSEAARADIIECVAEVKRPVNFQSKAQMV